MPGQPGLYIGAVDVTFSRTIVPDNSSPFDYPAFSAANVSFTADSVRLSYGGYHFPEGAQVQIDLTFVPEPASLCLMLAATATLGLCCRRR